MNKRTRISLIAILISLLIALSILIATLVSLLKQNITQETKWVLHSYGNNIALYNNDEIVEVYGSVALDTLPLEDRNRLDNGIVFNTREEALTAIEDYDG